MHIENGAFLYVPFVFRENHPTISHFKNWVLFCFNSKMERTFKPSSLLFIPFLHPSIRIVFNLRFSASVDDGPSIDVQPRDDWSKSILKNCNIILTTWEFNPSWCTHMFALNFRACILENLFGNKSREKWLYFHGHTLFNKYSSVQCVWSLQNQSNERNHGSFMSHSWIMTTCWVLVETLPTYT